MKSVHQGHSHKWKSVSGDYKCNICHAYKFTRGITNRDSIILEMRTGRNGKHPMTLEKIGYELGLSRERVRQRLARTLKIVREAATIDGQV